MKNPKIIIPVLIVLGLVVVGWFYVHKFRHNELVANPCLQKNEYADYTIDDKYDKEIKIPTVPVTVFVRDIVSRQIKSSFVIDNLTPLVQIRDCGIYVTREFNKSAPNYQSELWKYNYRGTGLKILTLATFENKKPKTTIYDAPIVDLREKYVVLERGYLGSSDYALVIKELSTLKDVFILTLDDIKKINPTIKPGIISLGKWSGDGKFVWGAISDGPLDTGYMRVEVGNWKTEILSTPPDLLSGTEGALNTKGYLAYADFPGFFGIDEIQKEEYARFRSEGRQKHLYVYNLFTKEKKLIASTSDPAHHFNLKWLSDTELEYSLPTGEKKIYKTP